MGENPKGDNKNGGGHGGKGCFSALLFFLLIAFVCGFLFVFIGLGTEKGKQSVQNWLEKQFSMEVNIGGARIGGASELVVENLVSKDADEKGEPVFRARELTIGFRIDGTFHVSVRKAVLKLTPGKKGGWTPGVFGKLGDLPLKHMGDLSKITGSFRRRVSLHITDSSITWVGADGLHPTCISGLSFDLKPLRLPERDVYFYRLEAYNVLGADNVNIHNVQREWLASDAVDYVAVDKLSPQEIVPASGFWEIK